MMIRPAAAIGVCMLLVAACGRDDRRAADASPPALDSTASPAPAPWNSSRPEKLPSATTALVGPSTALNGWPLATRQGRTRWSRRRAQQHADAVVVFDHINQLCQTICPLSFLFLAQRPVW